MTMVDDVEERRIRAAAVQAAGAFVGGSGMNGGDPYTLLFVAEVMETYIKEGSKAALVRYEEGAPEASEKKDSSLPQIAEGGRISDKRAQELADEAFSATSQAQISIIGAEAEREGIIENKITIGGKSGQLGEYLSLRAQVLPRVTPSASSGLRSELGL